MSAEVRAEAPVEAPALLRLSPDLHPAGQTRLYGVDFTSAPRRAKPITVAIAKAPEPGQPLVLQSILRFESLANWSDWLSTPGPWIGGFDLPFSLPRAFMAHLGWIDPAGSGNAWERVTQRLAELTRPELIAACRAWCDARPAGQKFAHRATDAGAGSSSSMKWVNPPVALMLHAGAPALMRAGLSLPSRLADPLRVALEAYPGLPARAVLGRTSYKSDEPARRLCPERRAARARLIAALQAGPEGEPPVKGHEGQRGEEGQEGQAAGRPKTAGVFGVRVDLGDWTESCLEDAGADLLDAVLCLTQAHQAWAARGEGWALPARIDPLEGWIIGAPQHAAA